MADIKPDFFINAPLIDSLILRLRSLDEATFESAMMEVTTLLGAKLEELGLDYPAQPEPRSYAPDEDGKPRKRKRYSRSGRLGTNLTSKAEHPAPDTYSAILGVDASYAAYVVAEPTDNPGQAWMHQGVWTPMIQQIRDNLPIIRQYVYEELNRRVTSYLL